MEITFEEKVSYSLDLSKPAIRRELADYLDITVKDMAKMVDKGTLYELHEDQLINWLESKRKAWESTENHPIEIDQILS